ncbi:MAG: hypothetical protein KatS3mg096_312 [Candidatus Parcubacteria bacterium]|nr:MAG: hypothetical protein KatS3mg096_312 [Candidatus Parcubacteria bacterium]
METTWELVQGLGLVVEKPLNEGIIVYGSADPLPNPAELILTQLVSSSRQLPLRFFVYRHCRNLHLEIPTNFVCPPGVFYLEDIIFQDLLLSEMAREIFRLRNSEPVIICYLPRPGREPKKFRGTDVPRITIAELHQEGGWLGGNAIHFILRLYAEEHPEVLYICPFQRKGRVYEIYKGMRRKIFILTPFLRLIPPPRLGLPEWAPTPWTYWLSLPASFRRRVRKIINHRLFAGERRIEITLP